MKRTNLFLIPVVAATLMCLFGWALAGGVTHGHGALRPALQPLYPPILPVDPALELRGRRLL